MVYRLLALVLFTLSVLWGSAIAAQVTPVSPAQTRALHALFDRQWEDVNQRFPEGATYRGDHRFGDRLTDQSPPARAAYDAQVLQWLQQARAIRREALSATDRVSLDLFITDREHEVEEQAFAGYRSLRMGSLGGAQSDLAQLMQVVPMETPAQVRQLLQRLRAYPKTMDQEIDMLRQGMSLGWVSSKNVLERVVAQIDGQLPANVEASPFYRPFTKIGPEVSAAEQVQLQAQARDLIDTQVAPALQKLRRFVLEEYQAAAPPDGALHHYPEGLKVYQMLVRHQTTTALSVQEIHATGLRELQRLRGEMEAVMHETRFEGNFAQFIEFLNTDPQFFHTSPQALLAGYRDLTKRADAELPRFFAELPRAPYGVRAMPDFMGPGAAEYYDGPALDGTRAGYFSANLLAWRTRPIWGMATLVAHETVPGHHLQVARSTELQGLPRFRRMGGYTAFVEGWALYAETLGIPMGLYDDPYSRFGHLQWQAFRAARLVVDTGIHSLGWTRQQAIDFMRERTGQNRVFIESEVDRYTSTPGQALAYMIGQLKIIELRDRARQQLGARFDLRRFHNAVIDNGALLLDTLDKLIDEWIAGQRRAKASPPVQNQ
ncbi:MAG: DUF885 domain-containing protein [Rhodoferax sp.]|nr:DUF885 domain-containing protein [Rhodoferax sp.]